MKSDIHEIQIAHTGWAVNAIEEAVPAMEILGYEKDGEITHDTSRNVNILIMRSPHGHCIELVAPMSDNSPISNFLKKNGPGPYHCCFTSGNFKKARSTLKQAGFSEISTPSEAPALAGETVVFLWSKHVGLIELSTSSSLGVSI